MLATVIVLAQEAAEQIEPDFVFDLNFLNLLAGAVVPLLVALVTKWNASSQLKAFANLFLSALAAYLTQLIANEGAFTLKEFTSAFLVTWIASLATYIGGWKPLGVAPKIADATSEVGIGKPKAA